MELQLKMNGTTENRKTKKHLNEKALWYVEKYFFPWNIMEWCKRRHCHAQDEKYFFLQAQGQ